MVLLCRSVLDFSLTDVELVQVQPMRNSERRLWTSGQAIAREICDQWPLTTTGSRRHALHSNLHL